LGSVAPSLDWPAVIEIAGPFQSGLRMTKAERIRTFLAQGIGPTAIAEMVGCCVGYVMAVKHRVHGRRPADKRAAQRQCERIKANGNRDAARSAATAAYRANASQGRKVAMKHYATAYTKALRETARHG